MIRYTSFLRFLPCLLVVSTACEQVRPTPTGPETHSQIQQYLTDDAIRHLNVSGEFQIASPASSDMGIITPERARQLALAYLKTWGPSHRPGWVQQRGASFDLSSLHLSDRIYFAETPVERFPDDSHPAERRILGPWYILHFEMNGEPILGIAVSAYGNDLEIRNGLVYEPVLGGSYFATSAVSVPTPIGKRAPYFPLSPEEAVAKLGSSIHAKISAVPVLVRRGVDWHPLFSLWKLPLDREIQVQRTNAPGNSSPGERLRVRELYMGPGGELLLPSSTQPGTLNVPVAHGRANRGQAPSQTLITVALKPGMIARFDQVSLVPEQ